MIKGFLFSFSLIFSCYTYISVSPTRYVQSNDQLINSTIYNPLTANGSNDKYTLAPTSSTIVDNGYHGSSYNLSHRTTSPMIPSSGSSAFTPISPGSNKQLSSLLTVPLSSSFENSQNNGITILDLDASARSDTLSIDATSTDKTKLVLSPVANKRNRGRPRKYLPCATNADSNATIDDEHSLLRTNLILSSPSSSRQQYVTNTNQQFLTDVIASKKAVNQQSNVIRGRGRPRKYPLVGVIQSSNLMTTPLEGSLSMNDEWTNVGQQSFSPISTATITSPIKLPSLCRLMGETDQQYAARKRDYMREYQRARRAMETPEERRQRLEKIKQYEVKRKMKINSVTDVPETINKKN